MAHHLCPVCSGLLRQMHRRTIDRLISQFYRVHRYQCLNAECQWTGLLHSKRHKAKKRQPQWWVWVLIVVLGVAIGLALFEFFRPHLRLVPMLLGVHNRSRDWYPQGETLYCQICSSFPILHF